MDVAAENYADYKRKQQFIELFKDIHDYELTGVLVGLVFDYVGGVINILPFGEILEKLFIYWTLFKKLDANMYNGNEMFLAIYIYWSSQITAKQRVWRRYVI